MRAETPKGAPIQMTTTEQNLTPEEELSAKLAAAEAELAALKATLALKPSKPPKADLSKLKRNNAGERFGNVELGKVPNPKWNGVNPATKYIDGDIFYFRCRSFVSIEDGRPLTERKQQKIKIARRDDRDFRSERSSALDVLADEKRAEILKWEAAALDDDDEATPQGDISVADFFNDVFLPDWRLLVANGQRAAITLATYENYWKGWLKEHFEKGSKTLKNYKAKTGRKFLETLRRQDGTSYNENTLRKVHSIARGIFQYAVEKNLIDHNVWKDISLATIPCKSAEQGVAYTEKEVEAFITNLNQDIKGLKDNGYGLTDYSVRAAQVALALGFWAGLRPSETVALRWENVDVVRGTITVCESIVAGVHAGRTKTGVDRVVPYLSGLAPILRRWKAENGNPTSGFVLQGHKSHGNVGAINLKNLADHIIYPNCKKNGLGELWKGNAFYALRRGCGTLLAEHGATAEEGSKFLGNTIDVFESNYLIDRGVLGARAAEKYEQNKQREAERNAEQEAERGVTESQKQLSELGLIQ